MTGRPNPFDDIDDVFDLMSRQFGADGGRLPVDVIDRPQEFLVIVDLPGYDTDAIDVTLVEDTRLRISAQRDGPDREGRYVKRERRRESVSRTITLPEAVDESETEATYENGLLEVRLQKRDGTDTEGTNIPVN